MKCYIAFVSDFSNGSDKRFVILKYNKGVFQKARNLESINLSVKNSRYSGHPQSDVLKKCRELFSFSSITFNSKPYYYFDHSTSLEQVSCNVLIEKNKNIEYRI